MACIRYPYYLPGCPQPPDPLPSRHHMEHLTDEQYAAAKEWEAESLRQYHKRIAEFEAAHPPLPDEA